MNERPERKLKIAMLGQKRMPSREGGVEIVVQELSTRMAARGHEVTCFNRTGHTSGGTTNGADFIDAYKGVKVRRVPTLDVKGFAAMSSSVIGSLITALEDFDVVHFHAEGPCATLWLPKLRGKKCIATIHGLDHRRAKWGRMASWYIKLGERTAVKYADEIIVLSKNLQKYFLQNYGRKTVYIPNGIDRPVLREAEIIKERFGLEKDGYILFVGRLVPEKGLRYLIEAFKKIKTDKKLVISGGASDSGEFVAEIRELARDDDRIIFTGFMRARLLSELYSNAYFYVLPSDLEGMPLTLMEAMSYGNCCLVSDIPECMEVIEDHALTFKHGDVRSLRKQMRRLLADPALRDSYKEGATDYICGKYGWEDVVDRTLAVYYRQLEKDTGK